MSNLRVHVRDFGALKANDPRLTYVLGKRLHWAAVEVVQQLIAGWHAYCLATRAPAPAQPLSIASGHRVCRWPDKAAYEAELRQRYNDRKDLPCREGRKRPCPCYDWPRPPRRHCLWLAYESAHETGLVWDFKGGGGLAPNSMTADKQKLLPVSLWLAAAAKFYNEEHEKLNDGHVLVNYEVEPWHWELIVPFELWNSASASATATP